jgi:uncharacterized protein YbjT (DUF2867 family)
MNILVAGASGFVGSRLCPALVEAGHHVKAMTRHPDTYGGTGTAVKRGAIPLALRQLDNWPVSNHP